MNVVDAIKHVTNQRSLGFEDMASVMTDIMTGKTTDAQNRRFFGWITDERYKGI